MITKENILQILYKHSYNVEDQAGNHLIVVDDDSWDAIATDTLSHLVSYKRHVEIQTCKDLLESMDNCFSEYHRGVVEEYMSDGI